MQKKINNIILKPKAEEDLNEILLYGANQFGLAQAEEYYLKLANFIENLSDEYYLGRIIKTSSLLSEKQIMMSRFKAHYVFYTYQEDEIIIIRVLYKNRDFLRHL